MIDLRASQIFQHPFILLSRLVGKRSQHDDPAAYQGEQEITESSKPPLPQQVREKRQKISGAGDQKQHQDLPISRYRNPYQKAQHKDRKCYPDPQESSVLAP